MKAALYTEFGGPIRVQHVPIPPISPDGILIQVKATGVCRSDWHGWKGHDADVINHGLPFCPGHEFSGIVVQVGNNVRKIKVKDRVTVAFILSCGECSCCIRGKPTVCEDQRQPGFTQWGSFAEYVSIPRADRNVKVLPRNVSFVQAAALGCRFTTAYRALLSQGRLQRGQTVAIFGCGGLGLSCIMIAKAKGASKIIAVDISPAALEKAKELGATHTILAQDPVPEKVRHIAPLGADISIDAAGFAATCENAIQCTRRGGGRMVQVGLPIGDTKPNVNMGLVAGLEIEIVGSHGFSGIDLGEMLDLVAKGLVDPGKLVGRQVDLATGCKEVENMDHSSPLGITMITNFGPSGRL